MNMRDNSWKKESQKTNGKEDHEECCVWEEEDIRKQKESGNTLEKKNYVRAKKI